MRFDENLQNRKEVEAIVLLARHLQDENVPFRIITLYDAQRSALEEALLNEDLYSADKCFNVDSFQGLLYSPRNNVHPSSLITDSWNGIR